MESETLPIVSRHPAVQAEYEAMRRDGVSHRAAEMFALRSPPGAKTDREFMRGCHSHNQFEANPDYGRYALAKAKAAGVNVTGAKYMSSLARFPGDPEAWVHDRHDVARICRERNWECDGDVKVKASAPDSAPTEVGIAEDLVQEEVASIVRDNPDAAPDQAKIAEKVRQESTPHWHKKD